MTQPLNNRTQYGETMALEIECMGSIAIQIANRWSLGWPNLTQKHLAASTFLQALTDQMNLEKDLLAEATDLAHLSRHEILQMHNVSEAPPPMP